MPLNPCKTNQGKTNRGFTLIEILVVVVIMSVMASMAVLTVNDRPALAELENEAKRFHAVLRILADDAIFQNREYGLVIEENQYALYQYDDIEQEWIGADIMPRETYELIHGLKIELEIEGEEMGFNEEKNDDSLLYELADEEDETLEITPSLLLLSSGEVTPFSVTFHLDGNERMQYTISSDGFSEIILEKVHNED